jgi:predicted nucleotidyltransferase
VSARRHVVVLPAVFVGQTGSVMIAAGVDADDDELRALCQRHGIVALALFGSALDGLLGPDSDIDLLATFAPDRLPGLISLSSIELELEALLGRRVDLRTANDLSPLFRNDVVARARPLYAAA